MSRLTIPPSSIFSLGSHFRLLSQLSLSCFFLLCICLFTFTTSLRAEVRVLRGITQIEANKTSSQVDLSEAIDTTRSLILISSSSSALQAKDFSIVPQFRGPKGIVFSRGGSGLKADITWQVLEFSSGVKVQRGLINISKETQSIEINPVNVSKSFAFINAKIPDAAFNEEAGGLGITLSSTHTLTVTNNWKNTGTTSFGLWQVVEYSNCKVQQVNGTIPTQVASATARIETVVDPTKSLIVTQSQWSEAFGLDQFPLASLTANGAFIQYSRPKEGPDFQFQHFIVEFGDGTQVKHSQIELARGKLSTLVPTSLVSAESRYVVLGSGYQNSYGQLNEIVSGVSASDKTPGLFLFTYSVDKSGLTVARSNNALASLAGLQEVQFAAAPTILQAPKNTAAAPGGKATFNIQVNSQIGLSYQWYKYPETAIGGAQSIELVLDGVTEQMNGQQFFCQVSNGTDTVRSSAATLSVENILIASPTASPDEGRYSTNLTVLLNSKNPGAEIYYTLDGSDPDPAKSLRYTDNVYVNKNTQIKALTYLGGLASSVSTFRYTIFFGAKAYLQDTLIPGRDLVFEDGMRLIYPGNKLGYSAVYVQASSIDSRRVSGFERTTPMLSISRTNGNLPMPALWFVPASDARRKQALYNLEKADAKPKVEHKAADSLLLSREGIFYAGIDTTAPTIEVIDQAAIGAGAVRLRLKIVDNVRALNYKITSLPKAPRLPISEGKIDEEEFQIIFDKTSDSYNPVRLKVVIDDQVQSATLPTDPTRYYTLSQPFYQLSNPNPVGKSWNLLSFPMQPGTNSLQLQNLIDQNKGLLTRAYVYEGSPESGGGYRSVLLNEALPASRAIWIKSDRSLDSISLASVQTIPSNEMGVYTLKLKKGWNQVANPALTAMRWPISYKEEVPDVDRKMGTLHLWNDVNTQFEPADTLMPWKGYFVYCYEDTLSVFLDRDEALLKKITTSAKPKVDFLLRLFDGGQLLTLASMDGARQNFSREDDLLVPTLDSETRVFLLRDKNRLSADWIPIEISSSKEKQNSVLSWTLVGNQGPLHLNGQIEFVPKGWEVWFCSKNRAMRYRVPTELGVNQMMLPFSAGLKSDTLYVLAGSPEALKRHSLWQTGQEKAKAWSAKLVKQANGWQLEMDLQDISDLQLRVWNSRGELRQTLFKGEAAEGKWIFPLDKMGISQSTGNQGKTASPSPEFLELEVVGKSSHESHREILSIPH